MCCFLVSEEPNPCNLSSPFPPSLFWFTGFWPQDLLFCAEEGAGLGLKAEPGSVFAAGVSQF